MGVAMKYMVTWNERPMGSAEAYEAAQKRILGVFSQWKMPDNLKVHQFLVRVGEYGGFMCLETDDLTSIHKLTSAFPAFQFKVDPVLDIQTAVAAEVEVIVWRSGVQLSSPFA
jgi:muconolactone delta-isomerase